MEVEVKLLNTILTINSRNLTDKNVIPYLNNVMFDIQDGRCRVVTGDNMTEIITSLKVENAEDGKFCIDGSSLVETMKLIDHEVVSITRKKSTVIIQAGKNKYRLGCMDANEFPRILTSDEDFIEIPTATADHIERAASYVKASDIRPSLTGIHMMFKDGFLNIQGTDAAVFYNGKMEVEEMANNCILNKKIVDVIGCFKQSVKLEVSIQKTCAVFTDGSITVKVRLIDDTFPDSEGFLSIENKHYFDINRNQFAKMLRRSNIYAAKIKDRRIIFDIVPESEQIKIGAEDDAVNKKFLEIMDVEKMNFEPERFALNPVFLSTVVNSFESEFIRIKKNLGKKQGVFFTDSEGLSGIDCFMAPVYIDD